MRGCSKNWRRHVSPWAVKFTTSSESCSWISGCKTYFSRLCATARSQRTRARLLKVVEGAVDQDRLKELTERAQLSPNSLESRSCRRAAIRNGACSGTAASAHYISAFFMEAFRRQGGIMEPREGGRWEVERVPARVRLYDHATGSGDPVLERYGRVCFDKAYRKPTAQDANAALIAPGHSLLDAVTDLTIEELGSALRQGARTRPHTSPSIQKHRGMTQKRALGTRGQSQGHDCCARCPSPSNAGTFWSSPWCEPPCELPA